MAGSSWTCPYCGRPVTITDEDISSTFVHERKVNATQRLVGQFITCPNIDCRKITVVTTLLGKGEGDQWNDVKGCWQLVPKSGAKTFPDYIPAAIREDYEEACKIRDLSPKAAATLARRCIQGIIRDYWGVVKPRLVDEINELKGQVDTGVWDALDAVRNVGNIGAHMEEDVNLIIEIEPNEAQLLIDLIEMLLKEWYVARHDRQEKLAAIKQLAAEKKRST